jgi:hypothetical protein
MKSQNIFKVTITFVILTAAGVGMVIAAQLLPEAFQQMALVGIGSALVAGSLAFYLNQMFNLDRRAKEEDLA